MAIYFPPAPAHRAPTYLSLFIPRARLQRIIAWSVGVAVVLAPLYWDETLWIGAGVALTVFVVWHTFEATKHIPWLPGLTVAVACVQWILAAWAAYHLEPSPTAISMLISPAEYFSYAVPATLALAVGLHLPLLKIGHSEIPRRLGDLDPVLLRHTCNAMFISGLVVRFGVVPFVPRSVQFVAELLATLAYVGGFGLMLIRAPRWRSRVALLFVLEGAIDSVNGIFYSLVIWTIYFLLLYLYTNRVSAARLGGFALAGVIAVLTLNGIKGGYREEIRGANLTTIQSGALAVEHFVNLLREPKQIVSAENLSFNVRRLNAGAIINRIMYWTPSREPYADGETIMTAIVAAAVPRFLAPTKYTAGGASNFPRFTGLILIGNTSINLSFAGEMYANFGRAGGVVGMFVAGFLIGLIFLVFVRLARESVLWWAWVPYLLVSVVSAEGGIAEATNQVVKSAIVMIAVIMIMPAWSVLRRHRAGRVTALRRTPASFAPSNSPPD